MKRHEVFLREKGSSDDNTPVPGLTKTNIHKNDELSEQGELICRTVFELAPDLIMICRPDGKAIYINQVGVEMLGVKPDENGELAFREALTEEYREKFKDIWEKTLREGQWLGELRAVRPGGGVFVLDSCLKTARLGDKKVVIVFSRDITERKGMEEQIEAGLREKETLLQDIHHRVKNNLEIILSLLRLQFQNATDAKARDLFRNIQNRILSMAMIYERLYQSEGLYKIDIKNYVNDLVQAVVISFKKNSHDYKLITDIDTISMGIKTAIPCGLIIIELVSNAIKYAFPDGRRGEVFIGLRADEEGWLRLTVRDNGIGLPEKLEASELKSLGLRLVFDLAKYQLQAETEIYREKGTRVEIRFKETRTR